MAERLGEFGQPMGRSPLETVRAPAVRRGFTAPRINTNWCLAFIAMTGLEFVQYSQTISAYTFMIAVIMFCFRNGKVALDAFLRGGILWVFISLSFASLLWSQDPSWAFRGVLQVALTIGAALILAGGLPPASFMTALMAALLTATLASILDPRMAVNAGVLGLIGIYGSKNQFGLSEALFFIVCLWTAFDKDRSRAIRNLARIGMLSAVYLMFASHSADSSVVGVGAIGCGFVALRLNWFPRGSRVAVLCGAIIFVSICFLMIFLVADNLSGSGTWSIGEGRDPNGSD